MNPGDRQGDRGGAPFALLDVRSLAQRRSGIQVVVGQLMEFLMEEYPSLRVLAPGGGVAARFEGSGRVVTSGIGPYDILRRRALRRVIRRSGCASLISGTHFVPPALGIPYALLLYDVIPLEFWMGRKSLYYRLLLPGLIAGARRVVTISEYSADRIRARFPSVSEIRVIQPVWIPACDPLSGSPRDRVLLAIAAPAPHKNVKFSVEVFRRLCALEPDWRLHIFGRFSREDKVRVDISDPRIQVSEDMPTARLEALYRRAWGILLPSRQEGFGLPLVEAMQAGVIPFYNVDTAMAEVAGEAGIGLSLKVPGEWVRAIREVWASEGCGRGLALAGLARAGMFDRARYARLARSAYAGMPGLEG